MPDEPTHDSEMDALVAQLEDAGLVGQLHPGRRQARATPHRLSGAPARASPGDAGDAVVDALLDEPSSRA